MRLLTRQFVEFDSDQDNAEPLAPHVKDQIIGRVTII